MRKLLKKALRAIGYDLVRYSPDSDLFGAFADLPPEQRRAILLSKPYTMTSVSRMVALVEAVTHVTQKGIEGDIVECGVWRGGSMMVTALTLLAHGDQSRTLWLYDTYEGMSEPTDVDKSLDGVDARTHWSSKEAWCYASIEDVRANLLSTGYPEDKIRLIKGKVEDTLISYRPEHVAVLRLDTDWYESTKQELVHLYPLLDRRGILIIDDYGHWQGARRAVDEYFSSSQHDVYLHRIDYTGRVLVRNGQST